MPAIGTIETDTRGITEAGRIPAGARSPEIRHEQGAGVRSDSSGAGPTFALGAQRKPAGGALSRPRDCASELPTPLRLKAEGGGCVRQPGGPAPATPPVRSHAPAPLVARGSKGRHPVLSCERTSQTGASSLRANPARSSLPSEP